MTKLPETSDTPGKPVAAVLLAAGEGSRFGGDPGSKLLAEYRGKPLVVHAMESLAESGIGEVFVVVADVSGEVAELAKGFGFRVVENVAAKDGQATSVAAGLRAVRESGGFGGMLVALGDQPLVGSQVHLRLAGAFRDGARVAVATYCGRWRNPAVFSCEVWDDLESSLVGDEGAKTFMKSNSEAVVEVECGDVGDAVDIDTRDDLEAIESEDRIEKRRVT